MPACKAHAIMRNKAYFCVRRRSATQQASVFGQPARKNYSETHSLSKIFLDDRRHDWSNRFLSDI